jgi:hypothetical protein
MSFKSAVLAVLTLAATAVPAFAGEGKFSALLFGDAYWMAANHDSTLEDMNGLWIRRFYLTYDQKFDDVWSGAPAPRGRAARGLHDDDHLPAFMKDAWLKWQHTTHSALIGIQPAPTVQIYEDVWGYRSIEKVPVELQGFGASRDAGLGLQGDFGEAKRVGYHLVVGNGASVGSETNTRKKAMGSIHFRPAAHLVLEGYADYDDRVNAADRITYYGFAGWQADHLRAGVQFAKQERREVGEDVDLRIISGFVTGALRDNLWLFGRVDRNMDPNPQGGTIAYLPFASISPTRCSSAVPTSWWPRASTSCPTWRSSCTTIRKWPARPNRIQMSWPV